MHKKKVYLQHMGKLHKTLTYDSMEAWIELAFECQRIWSLQAEEAKEREFDTAADYEQATLRRFADYAKSMRFSLAEGNRYTEGFPRLLRHISPRLLEAYFRYDRADILGEVVVHG